MVIKERTRLLFYTIDVWIITDEKVDGLEYDGRFMSVLKWRKHVP